MSVEDWAEIRRLHRAEGLPIKLIARTLGISRNTVRAALACDGPPKYERKPAGSAVDAFEDAIRAQLTQVPTMPATVIAERQLSRDKQLSRSRDQSLDHGLDLRSRQLLAAGRSSNSGLIFAHPFPSAAKEGFDGCTYLGERAGVRRGCRGYGRPGGVCSFEAARGWLLSLSSPDGGVTGFPVMPPTRPR